MATLLTSFLQNFVSHLTLPLKGGVHWYLNIVVSALLVYSRQVCAQSVSGCGGNQYARDSIALHDPLPLPPPSCTPTRTSLSLCTEVCTAEVSGDSCVQSVPPILDPLYHVWILSELS